MTLSDLLAITETGSLRAFDNACSRQLLAALVRCVVEADRLPLLFDRARDYDAARAELTRVLGEAK